MSLAEARAEALIGVFVSVTTIPAAADIGVSGAFRDWNEARGSLASCLNVAILIAVGAAGPSCNSASAGDPPQRATPHLNRQSGVKPHAMGTRHPKSGTWPYGWNVSAPPGASPHPARRRQFCRCGSSGATGFGRASWQRAGLAGSVGMHESAVAGKNIEGGSGDG